MRKGTLGFVGATSLAAGVGGFLLGLVLMGVAALGKESVWLVGVPLGLMLLLVGIPATTYAATVVPAGYGGRRVP